MVKRLFTAGACAECKGCCLFEKGSEWEIPAECRARAFVKNDMTYCFFLGEGGCALAEGKPFECSLYPFRVMRLGGRRVLAVSDYCPETKKLSLSALLEFAENNREEIISKTNEHPEAVKDYRDGYVILEFLPEPEKD
ncbi:MAG: hypothetical protein LBI36_07355 [Oscillospiraceae bacterium]|jgi:hypothetical protein|nr:hypothetical protein [Oscillospiraceae bacterium]